MKSARERADEFVAFADGFDGYQCTTEMLVERLALSFKEHARDQRHMIAERLSEESSLAMGDVDAHAVAMNTSAPGES